MSDYGYEKYKRDCEIASNPQTPLATWLQSHIVNVALDARMEKALMKALGERATVADLCRLTPEELLKIKGIGPFAAGELANALEQCGFESPLLEGLS